jgi:uncharacterized membrane protein YdbT with pleckstrin-like domain
MELSIRPDKRLFSKQWLILLTLSVILFLVGLLLVLLIPLGGKVTAEEVGRIAWPVCGGCIAFLWLIMAPILALWVKNLRYEIGEERITVHKGILTKVQQNIPYRAVTDFRLYRSLYDRFLGIGSIRIQTAGQTQTATGYEANLAGLADWDDLHQKLRAKVKALHPLSESIGARESPSLRTSTEVLVLILEELKAIRENLERR